jgi:hypothetical protein
MRKSLLIIGMVSSSFVAGAEVAVAGNEKDCREWCVAHPECDRCSRRLGCGVGHKTIKRFDGSGKSWYACAESKRSRRSKDDENACTEWCADHSECDHCSGHRECGPGYRKIESFKDSGKSWHACAKR